MQLIGIQVIMNDITNLMTSFTSEHKRICTNLSDI